jgi:hypothetical protein
LPDRDVISLPVLRKLKEFVDAGAVVIGTKPTKATGLNNAAKADTEVRKIADKLWSNDRISNRSARQVLLDSGVPQDFQFTVDKDASAKLDFIHRRAGEVEIYFVANRATNVVIADCVFRVEGKVPELWNAVTGEHRVFADFTERKGRTEIQLEFAPCGSWFVVFRESTAKQTSRTSVNTEFKTIAELTGSWTVRFDTNWAGPASVEFDSLVSWPTRPESGIKFFSGTATYEKTFDLPPSTINSQPSTLYLDLGNVRELAEVRVNGKSCGVTWTPPFRVDITSAVKPDVNRLEIEVVNFWPNRIIGDAALAKEQRLTRTNIRKLTKDTKLMESGLLGPVRVLEMSPAVPRR